MANELRERLRMIVGTQFTRIEQLEAENAKLKGAISWIEPPFVTDKTPEDELRERVRFVIADAKRDALTGSTKGER